MNNDKLMKIVQAVNDSRGEPVGMGVTLDYTYIARAKECSFLATGGVYAVNQNSTFKSWKYICTVEEFNQCVKEMSAGYSEKESDMSNKHPHYDLIVEWAKDTSKELVMITEADDLRDVRIGNVTVDIEGNYEFKFKPREFAKGHWYPCSIGGSVSVNMWDGEVFLSESCDGEIFDETDFDKIGKSLGVINFGGGE